MMMLTTSGIIILTKWLASTTVWVNFQTRAQRTRTKVNMEYGSAGTNASTKVQATRNVFRGGGARDVFH